MHLTQNWRNSQLLRLPFFIIFEKLLIQFIWEDSYGNEMKEKEKRGYEK